MTGSCRWIKARSIGIVCNKILPVSCGSLFLLCLSKIVASLYSILLLWAWIPSERSDREAVLQSVGAFIEASSGCGAVGFPKETTRLAPAMNDKHRSPAPGHSGQCLSASVITFFCFFIATRCFLFASLGQTADIQQTKRQNFFRNRLVEILFRRRRWTEESHSRLATPLLDYSRFI